MKKKNVLSMSLLAICLSMAMLCGCSSAKGQGTQDENPKTGQANAQGSQESGQKATDEEIEKAAQITIDELDEKTEWETMAQISLGDEVAVDGEGASEQDGTITIQKGGAYVLSGKMEKGSIVVDTTEAVNLILNGVELHSQDGPAIYGMNSTCLYVTTQAGTQNVVSDSGTYTDENAKAAIFSNDDLIFTGEGTLEVTGSYRHAICSDDVIYVENGTVQVTSATKDGFHANEGIRIDGGCVVVSDVNDAMESDGAMEIYAGQITLDAKDDGMVALGNLDIYGGQILIQGCEEGLEAKNALAIHDGLVEITAANDGLNAGKDLAISGGEVYANVSKGDGLDSNGTLEISGGLVVAMGAEQPEGGIDCDERNIVVTGGTLIACGGSNSAPDETGSTQASILLGSAKAGETLGILDEEGNAVFAFTPEKAYANLLLSIPGLQEGQTYTAYTGGTIRSEKSFHGYATDASYGGGQESVSFQADGMVIQAGGTAESGMPGGGMPNGQMPGGQMPNGQMPDGERKRPDGTAPSGDAQRPDGTAPSGDAQQPDGTTPSGDAQQPDGTTPSGDAQQPDGTAPSGDTQQPDGTAPSEETQTPVGGDGSV